MLDTAMKDQLKSVFAKLENQVDLIYNQSSHPDTDGLIEMLTDIQSTSSLINVKKSEKPSQDTVTPGFHIEYNGKPTGISFRGIPSGHEFTSLILAILNTDGKGKFPDAKILQRIKNLKGPIRLRTYISLSCENCPDVVQALNQMALIHEDFHHEMIDGSYVQHDISALGIQGVPSVALDSKIIHAGKIQFIDLLTKLETTFGTNASAQENLSQDLGKFDVVVVGGGPAGASAAIYSVRKGLKTALIAEKIGGQVQETKGIENLISVVYTEGPQLAAQLNQHLSSYPVQILEHRRVQKIDKETKTINLEGGEYLQAQSIIVTTGAKWRELGIPGEKEYIGRGVAFCPHCDGPYYKGKKIAVIGGGNSGVEAAIDLAGIVREIVLIEFNDQLKADQVLVDKLKSLPNVSIVTSAKTTSVIGDGQKVTSLEYQDRKTEKTQKIDLDGIFVQIGLLPNSQFLKDTVELTKFGEVVVDNKGRTSTPGIYAAGDVTTTPYKQIIIAMGEGAKAALAAFEDRMYNQAH
ncbi:MAG: alkyl hydroperoxide reductase subunit F [Oligoflexia bacterium]|nr:MAG: alkyl hydroperoxide reductase subunit F [Oligoflexia bacterium]